MMKRSTTNNVLEREIHGDALVHFDKTGFTKSAALDEKAFEARLKGRLEILSVTLQMFQPLVLKEMNRNDHVEAIAFYQAFALRPLVELLRIIYFPTHYDFCTRYLYYDLPRDVVQRLEKLFFVSNSEELGQKHKEAEQWFLDTIASRKKIQSHS